MYEYSDPKSTKDKMDISIRKRHTSMNKKMQSTRLRTYSPSLHFWGKNHFITAFIYVVLLSLVQGSIGSSMEDYQENVAKIYAGSWTVNSAKYSRDSKQIANNYYFEAIEMNTAQMGTYTFTSKSEVKTYGCIYNNSFDPQNPSQNLLLQDDGRSRKGQFKIIVTLQPDHKYILVVTTSDPEATGKFSVILFGPTEVNIVSKTESSTFAIRQIASTPVPISTKYSNGLFTTSSLFHRPDPDDEDHYFYYHAVQVSVTVEADYILTSDSDMDTFGYFYHDSFDPAVPLTNLITEDDDSGDINLQFRLSVSLTPGSNYVLVITTHADCEIGNFTIEALGPASVSLAQITPTPSQPITGLCSHSDLQSTYSGSLSSSSQVFYRPDADFEEPSYFQALEITVTTAGSYIFTSRSDLDTFGLLYRTNFDPSQPLMNLMTEDDDNGDDFLQFEIQQNLIPAQTYILVITTHSPLETGAFTALVRGPAAINLSPTTPSTSQPIIAPSTPSPGTVAYSGALSSSSQVFLRPDGDEDQFYYFQALQVRVSVDGTYSFSSDSIIDTMGYFYNSSFDPYYPTFGLITEDDDDGDINLQFRVRVYLDASESYVLVVTTHRESDTGSFSILVVGPSVASLTPIIASTSQTVTTETTTTAPSTSYSGALTYSNSVFYRPNGNAGQFNYFQALDVSTNTAGKCTITSESHIDTMAFVYLNSFDPSTPTTNLIFDDDDEGDIPLQFRIRIYLQPGQKYILVITTHRPYDVGRYTIRAVGIPTVRFTTYYPTTSQPIITLSTPPPLLSSYSGQLSSSSQLYYRPDGSSSAYYYFQALRISVSNSGFYSFRSSSPIDTRGYIYGYSFDPSKPLVNLLMDNDDSESSLQFLLHIFLRSTQSYILVVTTHREFVTGNFSVTAQGLNSVTLTEYTPSTSLPITTRATTPSVPTSFPGELSSTSQIFYRPGGSTVDYYYFQAIQVTASVPGEYQFTTVSTFDTRGYFYQTSFDPSDPSVNLLVTDDDGGIGLQFLIRAFLQTEQIYVLVVTTHREYINGNYSVLATGPNTLSLTMLTPSTSRPIVTQSTTTAISSSYQGALSVSSQSYNRPYGTAGRTYYFQAIQVVAPISGFYSFKSSSTMDTRGFFYEKYFDPSNPTDNLIMDDDDGGLGQQFLIKVFLQPQHAYVLVVTTHWDSVSGSFSVLVEGPAVVNLMAITPTTRPPTTTTTTIFTVPSTYTNALVSNSPVFYRPDGDRKNYYFHAITINVPISGSYTFTSNAYFDTVGYLYDSSFNPYNPSANLITFNDNCRLNSEFCITNTLSSERTYILVVTSSQPYTTGLFWLRVVGPAAADLTMMTLPTTTATNPPGTLSSSTLKGFASMTTSPTIVTVLCALAISILRML